MHGELGAYNRRQRHAMLTRFGRSRAKNRTPRLEIPFKCRNHAIGRCRAGILLRLPLGKRLRNVRKADRPPAILLLFKVYR